MLYGRVVVVIVTALAATVGSAQAGFVDGNTLFARCKTDDGHDRSFCYGYATGIVDSVDGALINVCTPGTVKLRQVKDIIVKYLEDHPERRQESAYKLGIDALTEAWPCL